MAAVVLAAPSARAHPDVDAAVEAYRQGLFDQTLVKLAEAEGRLGLTEDDLVTIHWYRAACHLASGQNQRAAASFDRLLELRPLFDPGVLEASPTVRKMLEERRAAYMLEHGVQVSAPEVQSGAVRVQVLRHAQSVAGVAIFARALGDPTFGAFELPLASGVAQGPLADPMMWERAVAAGALEVVVEARGPRGTPLARVGSARHPLVVELKETDQAVQRAVTPPAPTPTPAATVAVPPEAPPAETVAQPALAPPEPDPGTSPRPLRLGLLTLGGLGLGCAAALLVAAAASTMGAVGIKSAVNLVPYPWAGRNIVELQVAYIALAAAGGVILAASLLGALLGTALVVGGVLAD